MHTLGAVRVHTPRAVPVVLHTRGMARVVVLARYRVTVPAVLADG
jgi:hypothetical protein